MQIEQRRTYRDYIQDILSSIEEVREFVADMSFEEFGEDRKTVNAVVRSFEVMGEAVGHLPDSFKEKYSKMPWRKIADMRNKLIHEYFGVNLTIVWQTIKDDLPEVEPLVGEIITDLESEKE